MWKTQLTFAEAGDNGQPGRVRAPGLSHEEDEVFVSGLAEGGDLFAERLQRRLVVHVLHVQQLHSHVAVPAALVHCKKYFLYWQINNQCCCN